LTLVACGSSEKKTDNDDKTLVVGFDQNFPPFGFQDDNGEYTGFDIELAKEAAKRMDMEIVLQPIDWDAKDMELESGTIDCIWNGFTINGREDQYTWTDAYMDNSQVVVVRADSGIETLADLEGKIVEVQKESSAQSAIDDNEELKSTFGDYLQVADYNTAMMDLESGAVDAIAMDIFVAKDQIANKDGQMKILEETISTEQYGVGFLKGNTELRDQVQDVLKEMVKDGTFKEISEKWFDGADVCILKAE
jgi:polar amino acid transport system substrate-binding protein